MTALPGKPAANATPAHESGVEGLAATSPGARLQKGREAAKLDVAQAADALHLSPGVVKALEADDYRVLPNATFVKGYIRSYARLVGVPGEELVRSYEAITGSGNLKSPEPVQAQRSGFRLGAPLLVGAGLVLVVLMALVFWPSGDDFVAEAPASEPQAAAPQVAASETIAGDSLADEELVTQAEDSQEPEHSGEPSTESLEASGPEEPENQPVSEPADVAPAPAAPVATEQKAIIVEEPRAAAPVTANDEAQAATGLLDMAFTGDCWVEVRDGLGNLIYSNLKRHGETQHLEGVPPFEAKFGNGNVVSLSYNGQPVSFRVPSHNVVRVRLGE